MDKLSLYECLTMERDPLKEARPSRYGSWNGESLPLGPHPEGRGFPAEAACGVAEVSNSPFYARLARSAGPTDAEWEEVVLVNGMRRVHEELDDTYGSPG